MDSNFTEFSMLLLQYLHQRTLHLPNIYHSPEFLAIFQNLLEAMNASAAIFHFDIPKKKRGAIYYEWYAHARIVENYMPRTPFRENLRMSTQTFDRILNIVKHIQPGFWGQSDHPRLTPVDVQLATGLFRLASRLDCHHVAIIFGISTGSVINFTRKTLYAIGIAFSGKIK